jgi:elongation factor Ts
LGPGAASGDELFKQPSPSEAGKTLGEVKDDLFNRMREVFNIGRVARLDGPCGGYAHHDGSIAALVEIEGGNADAAKDVAMHVVAQNPSAVSKENLDPALVQKEREILSEAARKEGKPENIIQKMIEGRLRNFYAERVLLEQPFVKDDKKSVGQYAKENGMQVKHFIRWQMGKTTEA